MTVLISQKLLALPEMRILSWQFHDSVLHIMLCCRRRSALCPGCGTAGTRVHGRYRRQLGDLPCHGHRVRLEVDVRRFRCSNPLCGRLTFAKTLLVAALPAPQPPPATCP